MIEPSMSRALTELLDWQLWYWGQDIHHANGNALLAFGFERHRGPDDGTHRSTAYRLATNGTTGTHPNGSLEGLCELTAWGFGISALHQRFVTPHQSVLLVRHERSVGLCSAAITAQAGTRDTLPDRQIPRCASEWACLCTTLIDIAHCCATYERWARTVLHGAHRTEAHLRRPRQIRRRHELPHFLDDPWSRVARRLAAPLASLTSRDAGPAEVLS